MPQRKGLHRDVLLFAWLTSVLVAATALTNQRMIDWSFSVAGAKLLFSARWSRLFTDNPNAQTGPITHLLAWPLDQLGIDAARVAIMVVGVVVVALLVWSSRGLPGARVRLAVGGTAFALWWPQLGSYGHLDDAVVLVIAVGAVWSSLLGRQRQVGVLTGLALGTKPTAVFLVALTLPLRAWRNKDAWAPFLLAVVVALVIYGPFIAGSDSVSDILRPKVFVRPDSVLRLVLHPNSRPSSLFRTAQMVAVVGSSTWAMRRHGPAAVLWIGVATRLLLDPAGWAYYTVGFVLGALLWELFVTRPRVPWATILSALLLAPPWMVPSDLARAWLRLLACAGAIAVIAFRRAAAEPAAATD